MATTSLCRNCGLTFTSLAAFDAHRIGSYGEPIYKPSRTGKSRKVIGHTHHTRRCMTLPEIIDLGMTQNDKGWWMLPASTQTPWVKTAHEQEGTEATRKRLAQTPLTATHVTMPSSRGRSAAALHHPNE